MTIRYPFLHRARLAIRNNRPLDPITARQMLTALEELANYIERLERIAANEQPDLCELLEETGLVPTEEVRRIRAEQQVPKPGPVVCPPPGKRKLPDLDEAYKVLRWASLAVTEAGAAGVTSNNIDPWGEHPVARLWVYLLRFYEGAYFQGRLEERAGVPELKKEPRRRSELVDFTFSDPDLRRVIEARGTLRGPAPSVGTGEGEA